jgi:UDP-N-acetylglucosamine transferase subunit ALG13
LIFVAVGTQLPFDRLIRTMDEWAARCRRRDIVAQVGPTTYRANNIQTHRYLDSREFRRCVGEADLIVSHAGMGTIITALELAKPVIVMPRRAELLEHRNDHQLATARRLLLQRQIRVAFKESDLLAELDNFKDAKPPEPISAYAQGPLIEALTAFLDSGSGSMHPSPDR